MSKYGEYRIMTLKQTIHSGFGSLEKLEGILKNYDVSRVMVVTGKKSFESSGAKAHIISALKDFEVTYFSDFETNPKLDDARKGVKLINKNSIELLICVGGGSVIDMTKLIKAFCLDPDKSDSLARGMIKINDPNIPIISIPTTAGSGSESTHFAVVYINQDKFSVAHNCLFPNEVVLDGQLTISASRYQKACNVLDAISQSIESAWAVGATKESQKLSYTALKLCMGSFEEYVNSDNSINAAQSMIEASNFAGQAINISKTTAAHAWSYGISMRYSIPHGHAVWTTLPRIFKVHSTEKGLKVNDPRGAKHFNKTMKNLKKIMKISNDENLIKYFDTLLTSIGIKENLKEHIAILESERKSLSVAVNQERMSNNPVEFSDEQVDYIFEMENNGENKSD